MGYNLPTTLGGTTVLFFDDASGYIGKSLSKKFEPERKCERCGKVASWVAGGDKPHSYLCAQCSDEWDEFLKKHPEFFAGRMTEKKWFAAFKKFLKTKPRKVDLDEHNRRMVLQDIEIAASMEHFNLKYYKKLFPDDIKKT